MMVLTYGSCERCGTSDIPVTEQEAEATCQKCGERFKLCLACQRRGCPSCRGKLQSAMDWARKNHIRF